MRNKTSNVPSPYPGPRPFEPDEHDFFFGRAREISELVSLVIAHRLILLYARSGAGKSSLLNAGLIPALRAEGFQILPVARVRGVTGQGIDESTVPNIFVFNALMSWAGPEADSSTFVSQTLPSFLSSVPYTSDEQGLRLPRLVIFDQFEELFSLYLGRWQERTGFFQQITDALKQDPLLRVLFVIREDYLASMDSYAALLPEQLRNRFHLELLDARSARLAVEDPLKKVGRSFAPGVADELVQELLKIRVETASGEIVQVTGEFIEPVQLQVVCQNLWLDLPPDTTVISPSHLRAFGNVDQALKGYYERGIKDAQGKGAGERQLRNWFEQRLITPLSTRALVLRGKERTEGMPNAVVDRLEDLHLIHAEWRAGARWYELTHDRFIKAIQSSNSQWRAARLATFTRIGVAGALVALLLVCGLLVVMLNVTQSYPSSQVSISEQKTTQAELVIANATGTQQAQAVQQANATVTLQAQVAQQANATATRQAQVAEQQRTLTLQQAQIAQQLSVALLTETAPKTVLPTTPTAVVLPTPTRTPTLPPSPTATLRFGATSRPGTPPPPNSQATRDAQANATQTALAIVAYARQTATASALAQQSATSSVPAQQTAAADATSRANVNAAAASAATLSARIIQGSLSTACVNSIADWLMPALHASPLTAAILACPTDSSHSVDSVVEPFERGQMLWLSDSRQIYVLAADGTYMAFVDTWQEGQPAGGFYTPPQNRFEPARGFGLVWREQLGGPRAQIGWATAPESLRPADIQNFDGGLAYRAQDGNLIFTSDGRWFAYSAAAK